MEKEVLTPGLDEFGFEDIKITEEKVTRNEYSMSTYGRYCYYEDDDPIKCYIIDFKEE